MTRAPSNDRAPAPPPLDPRRVRGIVAAALAEDLGGGDVTTEALIPAELRARGRIVARESLVVCGLPIAGEVFLSLDPHCLWREPVREGQDIGAGAEIAVVEGRARAILTGERTALNFLQRLSGIATLARAAVREVAGTGARILDTRKTTPTLRDLEKYAVRTGGAVNHRASLNAAVLVKDNHVALCGGIAQAVGRAREAGLDPSAIEVEVDDLAGLDQALAAGVGRILLDNFTPGEAAMAVRRGAGRALIEISGGLAPGRLRAYAESGADFLSLGGLTHSARSVDLSMEMETLP